MTVTCWSATPRHFCSLVAEDMIICLEAFSKEEKLVDGDVVEIKATDHDEQSMYVLLLRVHHCSMAILWCIRSFGSSDQCACGLTFS